MAYSYHYYTTILLLTCLVRANAPGYVSAIEENPVQQKAYHIDDSVFLTMTKGSVITGTITDEEGEPMIAIRVRAVRVRDTNNRKTASADRNTYYTMSDDRGIYRLFGLRAGIYLIYAGGSDGYFFDESNASEHPPVFYPSSTYDNASEVSVQAGQETSGVNIRFREIAGYTISGVIANAKTFTRGLRSQVNVSLKPANASIESSQTYIQEKDGKFSFSLDSIADGEYLIRAFIYSGDDDVAYSEWQKVTIKGADVSGLSLTVFRLSSLMGKVISEESKEKKDEACKDIRASSIEEIIILLPRDEKGESVKDAWSGSSAETGVAPDENGVFTIKANRSGKRRIIIKLPNEDLFVRSITAPNTIANKPPLDVGKNGIALKSGEQVKDVKVTIAEGAAKVSGKVIPANENTSLPDNLLVHLVPVEKESGDDVLRYFETTIEDDGSFSIVNIPSGKYFILIGKMKAGEEKEVYRRPVAWDDLQRAKLRKDAEAANQTIELTPCKRINDFVLKMK